jgi:hypothetical protein
MKRLVTSAVLCILVSLLLVEHARADAKLTGVVKDSDSGGLIPARIYVQSEAGKFFFVKSNSPNGSSIIYDKARDKTSSL